MISLILKTSLAATLGFALIMAPAAAVEKKVDCDKGQSLQAALETATGNAEALEIQLDGTCEEVVTITRDRVSIVGNDGATIAGRIRIFGPGNVTLRDLTITGPGPGLGVWGGRTRMFGVSILDNTDTGIVAQDGATIRFSGGQVSGNGGSHGVLLIGSNAQIAESLVAGHPDRGIAATENSRLRTERVIVTGNGLGIEASMNSSLSLEETEVSYNGNIGLFISNNSSAHTRLVAIQGHSESGISLRSGSSVNVEESIILDNFNGIEARAGDIHIANGAAITANQNHGIDANVHSSVQLENSYIYFNQVSGVRLEYDSGLLAFDGVSIYSNFGGDVFCTDAESSAQFLGASPATVFCTGF